MNRLILASAAALAASCAHADAFPAAEAVPDASGRYDLASQQCWGGTIPTAATEVKVTGGASRFVTASGDVEFGLLVNGLTTYHDYNLTFDMTGYATVPTLKFKGFASGGESSAQVHTTFKGGNWDFGNAVFGSPDNKHYGNNHSIVVTDGAVMTNISNMNLGRTTLKNQKAEIAGNSHVTVSGQFYFSGYKSDADVVAQNYLKVYDGAVLDIGRLVWEDARSAWANLNAGVFKDYLLVSNATMNVNTAKLGDGSTSYAYFGRRGQSLVNVTCNGSLHVKTSVIAAEKHTVGNLVRVADGGMLTVDDCWYGGWDGGGQCGLNQNRVEILENGTMTVASKFYLGYSNVAGNTLVVSNGTFTATDFAWGSSSGCSNETIRVQGKKASFSFSSEYVRNNFHLFAGYPNCTFEILDGAAFSPAKKDYFAASGAGKISNCMLRIAHEGRYEQSIVTAPQTSDTTSLLSFGNKIIVEDGGKLSASYVYLRGKENSLRVDDGTVSLSSGATSLYIGSTGATYGGRAEGCVLTLAGSKPSVSTIGGMTVDNASKIVFELPEAGYAQDCVPLDIDGDVTWKPDCSLEFVGSEAMLARHRADGIDKGYVLLRVPTGKTFLPDSVIGAAGEALGSGFRLYKSVGDGYQKLVLKARLNKGLAIILR